MTMTYERGKQPNDAPVAWDKRGNKYHVVSDDFDPYVLLFVDEGNNPTSQLDTICRAFHLAKLAEESAKNMARRMDAEDGRCCKCDKWCKPLCIDCGNCDTCGHATDCTGSDWLRRYRAAKGEA